MKRNLCSILFGCMLAADVCAQGVQVQFQNKTGTGETGGSPVTNSATGHRVDGREGWVAALYYGPVGMPENLLVPLGGIAQFTSPGFFDGGTVILPLVPATLQVRVWNSIRFPNYRAAVDSCSDLSGKSKAFVLEAPPFLPPGGLVGLRSFNLLPCDRITASIAFAQPGVTICWTSQSNAVYRVEYSAELKPDGWSVLVADVAGTGSATCVPDRAAPDQQTRFYRVLRTSTAP